MFFAINHITKEKVNSITIEQNPSYNLIEEDTWFADPDEIDRCPTHIDITKIIVKFRQGSNDIINSSGTKYDISPHFFIPNKTKLGIDTIPESKEHKLAKNWIYNKLKKDELKIAYSSVSKPIKYNNIINLFELPIDKNMIGIESSSAVTKERTYRRADIICPFITKHPILGNGIVFEIQFSKQQKNTKESRELDWAIRGYSICWIFSTDIAIMNENIFETKEEELRIDSFAALIKKNNTSLIRNLKYTTKEEMRKIEWKRDLIMKEIFNAKLEKISFEKEEIKDMVNNIFEELKSNIQPICPKCKIYCKLIDYNNNKFWGCSNYPTCKWTSAYME